MKNLFKRLFKTAFFRWAICYLVAIYIRFVYYTSRIDMDMHKQTVEYMETKRACIFAFWHGRMLMIPMIHPRDRCMNVLISTHRDGEMIARTMHHFGFATIRGSSTRGGARAALRAVKALLAGENVAFTPDGPKGPLMKIQPGVLTVAELAGVPILPMTFSATRHKIMRSWDRFFVPLPFGTIFYGIGAPMMGANIEILEKEMMRLMQEMDIKAGIH